MPLTINCAISFSCSMMKVRYFPFPFSLFFHTCFAPAAWFTSRTRFTISRMPEVAKSSPTPWNMGDSTNQNSTTTCNFTCAANQNSTSTRVPHTPRQSKLKINTYTGYRAHTHSQPTLDKHLVPTHAHPITA